MMPEERPPSPVGRPPHTISAGDGGLATGDVVRLVDGPDERAYLLDGGGAVIVPPNAGEPARELGRAVAGVRRDADRAVRYLSLGAWCAVVIEGELGAVAIAPLAAGAERIVVVSAPKDAGAGYARRLLSRAASRAASMLMLST